MRGTFAEYTLEHDADCIANGIIPPGKIGYINGVPAPNNQRTIAMYDAFQNPDGSDDYIWKYTQQELSDLGWDRE